MAAESETSAIFHFHLKGEPNDVIFGSAILGYYGLNYVKTRKSVLMGR